MLEKKGSHYSKYSNVNICFEMNLKCLYYLVPVPRLSREAPASKSRPIIIKFFLRQATFNGVSPIFDLIFTSQLCYNEFWIVKNVFLIKGIVTPVPDIDHYY